MSVLLSLLAYNLLLPLLHVSAVSTNASCLMNEDCVVQDDTLKTRLVSKTVDNTTFCCANQSDYIDMALVAPGNVTCYCTSVADAAAAYADQTMGEGRACHWGSQCEGVEEAVTVNGSTAFCCLGNGHQYVHATFFGAEELVCRCYGSMLPSRDSDAYQVPDTNNSKSSGEACFYNHDCADYPSTLCFAEKATFCCYGSRGLETVNDPQLNITRCTCTNEFTGTGCASSPYPVLDPDSEETGCRSGEACQETSDHFTCSHGDTTFCCPRQGINLTIVDDIITSCTCMSAGRQCNMTYASTDESSRLRSSLSAVLVSSLILVVTRS